MILFLFSSLTKNCAYIPDAIAITQKILIKIYSILGFFILTFIPFLLCSKAHIVVKDIFLLFVFYRICFKKASSLRKVFVEISY